MNSTATQSKIAPANSYGLTDANRQYALQIAGRSYCETITTVKPGYEAPIGFRCIDNDTIEAFAGATSVKLRANSNFSYRWIAEITPAERKQQRQLEVVANAHKAATVLSSVAEAMKELASIPVQMESMGRLALKMLGVLLELVTSFV